jgi:myo-inositol-1(or 4)-monophosphatase
MILRDIPGFIDELAALSGAVILPFFRAAVGAEDKSAGRGAFDPVTEADRGAERVIRQAIAARFPDHGVIGEEFGVSAPGADYVWVLDPIDGTKSFISGLPLWGTLIGLQHMGRPVYGLMHQPFTQERFSGDGRTARWRGFDPAGAPVERVLRTRPCAALEDATVMTTSPLLLSADEREKYRRVEERARLHRYGGDCYAYCMLAAGHVDLVIEAGLKPYDIAALIPIIEGAGGIVSTWDGGDAAKGGAILAAGDARAHAAALALLSGAAD